MGKSVTAMLFAVAAVLLVPLVSYSAGLGKLTVRSALGQPLDAEIEIVSLRPGEDESFVVRLASSEAFREAGIDLSPALAGARFTVERRGGKPVIRITTTQPVNDPFLSVLVELQWASGRLAREYTFLVDPIEYRAAAVAAAPASSPAPVQSVAQTPAPAPVQSVAATPAAVPAPVQSVAQTPAPVQSVAATPAPAPAPVQSVAATPAAVPAPIQPVAQTPAPAPAPIQPVAQTPAPVPAPAQVVAPVPAPSPTQAVQVSPAKTAAAVDAPSVRSAPRRDAAETYKIKRGDTLGAIARKRKPDGVTLNQMLIALHQTNRNAFIRDNINLIRAGKIITIPGRDEVAAIDSADAFRRVISQMADFARYRRHQGATVASASMRPASGQRDLISRRVAVRKAVRSM